MLKSEKWMKLSGVVICEIFTLITIIKLLAGGEPDRMALAVGTLVLVALPTLIEKLFRCRISLPVYIFALAYAIGPMLGHCWKLYYTVPVWDKLLHRTFAGSRQAHRDGTSITAGRSYKCGGTNL